MTNFAGMNVLITGAGAGIGRLLADSIIGRGGFVIAWDINQEMLDQLLSDYTAQQVAIYNVDIAQKTAIQAAGEQVIRDHGGVDILINNAGIVQGRSILDCDDDAIKHTFDINILAHFWTVRAFLPGMIERSFGHIVTVASAAAFGGAPHLADYTASKGAAFNFDESLRQEFKNYGYPIKTTVICPWYINTGMFKGVTTRFPFLLPIYEPQEVADRTIKAIEKDHARLVMPLTVYSNYLLRFLPPAWFDRISSFFGVTKSMDNFSGHGQ